MYILLALFFLSLLSISIMLGRQVVLLRNGSIIVENTSYHPLGADVIKIKYVIRRGMKRYGYLALVGVLRVYFRAKNELKDSYRGLRTKIREAVAKKTGEAPTAEPQAREASGFLKMIVEYKRKLRTIKHRIKEEEENK